MSGHAKLAPSAAHRWMHCAGSVALCSGFPSTSSVYADEGTFAHGIASRCLTEGLHASRFIGNVSSDGRFRVDKAMADAIQVYLDVAGHLRLLDGQRAIMVEQKVSVSKDVYGTADLLLQSENGKILHVVDLKMGKGVFVEVENNEQEMIYGLGALLTFASLLRDVETVELHIVQPRFFGDCPPWRSAKMSAGKLRTKFASRLVEAVKATEKPRAPLVTGDHCRFCAAKAVCPQLKKEALSSAQHAFAVPATVALEPKTLDAAEVARLLPLFTRAEEWISAIRAHAYELANNGKAIPGYKLVAKVGHRKWRDDNVAQAALSAAGVDPLTPPKLISPAEAERKLGKAKAGLVDPLTVKPATGTVLVEESDKRPAIAMDAASMFPAIEAE